MLRSPWTTLAATARSFLRERRGSIAVMLGVAIVPLVAALGLAVDSGRGYLVKSRLGQAVDAAALAGGRAIFAAYRDADIKKYFEANFPLGYMGSSVQPLSITVDENGGTIEVTASATVPTTFLAVLSVHHMTVQARAVVKRQVRGMEVALVMDNTGSMASGGKIGAMKQAATNLVELLYGDNETIEDFWISLVPYTATVNVGAQHTDWLMGYSANAYLPTTWKGCVEARDIPHDTEDAPPADRRFMPFYWISTIDNYLSERPTLKGDNDWNAANIDETQNAGNDGLGPNLGCGPAITPLIARKSEVLAAIAEMNAWSRGGTMSNLGLVWGWRSISPRWRGLWDGDLPNELPKDYDEPLMDKVVILLTDGENQWYDWPGGLPGSPKASTYPGADYTAYGRLNAGRLGTSTNNVAKGIINQRMLSTCNKMKQKGIRIYTIVFQENDPATQNIYKNCATSAANYFMSPSNSDLIDVFRSIGSELASLRLAE